MGALGRTGAAGDMTPEPTTLVDDVEAPAPIDPLEHDLREVDEVTADNGSLGLLMAFIGAIMAIGFLRSWWIPAIIGGLLVVLFMHELGHFVTARMSGMKVTEFFLGFGPKIWSFQRGETEYGIKGIPGGAYVRIMGMTNLEDIDPAEEHRTYRAQPYWQRMITICAGSAMHFLMALLALFALFLGYTYNGFNGPPWYVNLVVPGSTAAGLGIEEGDQIKQINGDGFSNWDEFGNVVSSLDDGPIEVVVNRDGEELRLQGVLGLRPEDVVRVGFGLRVLDELPDSGAVVSSVWPGEAADRFGLEAGDVLVSAGGVDQPTEQTLSPVLVANRGEQLTIDVLRDGEQVSVQGTVELNPDWTYRGFFGIGPVFVPEPEPGVFDSAGRAVDDFGAMTKMTLRGVVDLVTPSNDESNPIAQNERVAPALSAGGSGVQPSGQDTNRPLSVVGIGRMIADSDGLDQVLFMFAMVNIFIGLFNLFPVLPLDGGHALIATYERVRGLASGKPHRVDAAKLIPVTWLVIIALVGVGVWTFALDIFAWPAS